MRTFSINRSIADVITAARLQAFNQELDNIYVNGDDIWRVKKAVSWTALKVDIGSFPYQVHGAYGIYAGTTDLAIPDNSTKYLNINSSWVISIDAATDSNKALLAQVITLSWIVTTIVNYKSAVFGWYAGTGDMVGPASSVAGNIPTFANTTWKLIQDSWIKINTILNTLNTEVPTSAAVKNGINSFVVLSNYPLGEAITNIAQSCVFKETAPTFAQATTVQNIGDVTGNTRAYLYGLSNWVYSSTFKISLKKILAPTVAFNCRLQQYNGSAWIDVDVTNAIATIAAWTVTTSFVDTSMTWAGTFTMPVAGTLLRLACFVWTRWSETISATNYYAIWYYNINTTTRYLSTYNWTTETNTGYFPYWNWSALYSTVLSLTNPDYSYKVDLYGISTAIWSIGSFPYIYLPVDWAIVPNFTWMVEWDPQYLNSDGVYTIYWRKQLTKDTDLSTGASNTSNTRTVQKYVYASHTPTVNETITGVKINVKYSWYTWNTASWNSHFNVKIYLDSAGSLWTLVYTWTDSWIFTTTSDTDLIIALAWTLNAGTKYWIEVISILNFTSWQSNWCSVKIAGTRASTYNDYATKDILAAGPFTIDNTKSLYFELQVTSPTLTSIDNWTDTYPGKIYWTIKNVPGTNALQIGKWLTPSKFIFNKSWYSYALSNNTVYTALADWIVTWTVAWNAWNWNITWYADTINGWTTARAAAGSSYSWNIDSISFRVLKWQMFKIAWSWTNWPTWYWFYYQW